MQDSRCAAARVCHDRGAGLSPCAHNTIREAIGRDTPSSQHAGHELSEGTARAAQLAPSAVTAGAVGGPATRGVVGRVSRRKFANPTGKSHWELFGRRVGLSTSGSKSEWAHGGRGSLTPLGPSPLARRPRRVPLAGARRPPRAPTGRPRHYRARATSCGVPSYIRSLGSTSMNCSIILEYRYCTSKT